jgi:signal peptidase II
MTQRSNDPMTQAPIRALRPMMFYLIVLIVFAADQMSKISIQKMMAFGESRPVIGDAFRLTLTQNTGGAWGLLPSGNKLFVGFAIVAVLALTYAYHRMPKVELYVGTAFALAMGGALGNLTDRLRYGYVVDFFHAKIINWPVFNVADSAITLGIVFLLIHLFRSSREDAEEEKRRRGEEERGDREQGTGDRTYNPDYLTPSAEASIQNPNDPMTQRPTSE